MGKLWRIAPIICLLGIFPARAQVQPGQGVTQSGAVVTNDCAKWAGSNQISDSGAPCGSGSPTGAAGGSLTGTYPNPGLNVGGTTTGVLPAVNGGTGEAGTITGALKGNGTSPATQAACADLSNGTTNCSAAVGQLPGTTTNDNAAAGKVGEYTSSIVLAGAAVSMTSTIAIDVTTLTLSGGDWDVSGLCANQPNSTTVTTEFICNITTTANTLNNVPSDGGAIAFSDAALGAALQESLTTDVARVSITTSTTYHLVARSTFSGAAATNGAFGKIRARRVR